MLIVTFGRKFCSTSWQVLTPKKWQKTQTTPLVKDFVHNYVEAAISQCTFFSLRLSIVSSGYMLIM